MELARLILTIRDQLNLKSPKEVYIPYGLAGFGQKGAKIFLRMLTKLGLKASLPPELMFLSSFYKTQTLSCEKLATSSFKDPFPEETVYTRLPEMITLLSHPVDPGKPDQQLRGPAQFRYHHQEGF